MRKLPILICALSVVVNFTVSLFSPGQIVLSVVLLSLNLGCFAWLYRQKPREIITIKEVKVPEILPTLTESPISAVSSIPPELLEEIQMLRVYVEIAQKLKNLVSTETEQVVESLTSEFFELLETSQAVSAQIERSMTYVSSGDAGLGKTVSHIHEQGTVYSALSQNFERLSNELAKDLSVLTETVNSINEFSYNISDLADQTNVLAINASIEAARVGVNGKGFAVIASQVQVLSQSSQVIAEKMARTVREVIQTVESSFSGQQQRIGESQNLIRKTEKDLLHWSELAMPQVAKVQEVIASTQQLSGSVTNRLNSITISLQFQDRIRQMLNHSMAILQESLDQILITAQQSQVPISSNLRQKAQTKATSYFTIDQEWVEVTGETKKGTALSNGKRVELF